VTAGAYTIGGAARTAIVLRSRAWVGSARRQSIAALLLFAGLDLAFFGTSVVPHLKRTCLCGPGPDPFSYMWFLAWWPHALLHAHNPFVTHALFAPEQINLGAIDLVPGPALLAAPVTLLFGPLVSYNLLALAAPVLAAYFAFLLCRYVTNSFPAALVGGYIFGFSPYVLGHLQGHLDLLLIFPIPAAVHLVLRLIDERIDRRRFLMLMTLVLAFLFVSQPELTVMFVLLGTVAFAVALALAPGARGRLKAAIPLVLAAGVAAAVLTSVFIYYGLTGDKSPKFFNGFGNTFVADTLGFVIPTPVVRFGRTWFSLVARDFSGGTAENGVYIGIPLVLVLLRYEITRWRTPVARVLLGILAVTVVLMLGSHLRIGGHATIPMPWKWIGWLPLLNEMAPARFGAFMFLIVGLMVAIWLGQPRRGKVGVAKWVVAAIGLAALLPNLGAAWHSQPPNPPLFTTARYRTVLRHESNVLNANVLGLRYSIGGDSMLWQAETGFWFRLTDGSLGALLPRGYERALVGSLSRPTTAPLADPASLRAFLRVRRVDAVLVDARNPQGWPQALAALGLHPQLVGGVIVYHTR